MADSLRLAVRKNLVTSLQAINGLGAYTTTVKATSVFRSVYPLTDLPTSELPGIVVAPFDPKDRTYQPAEQLEESLNTGVYVLVNVEGQTPATKDDTIEGVIADVERALTVDITRGGLVIDTRLGQPITYEGQPGTSLVLVEQPVEIRLHRTYGQP